MEDIVGLVQKSLILLRVKIGDYIVIGLDFTGSVIAERIENVLNKNKKKRRRKRWIYQNLLIGRRR